MPEWRRAAGFRPAACGTAPPRKNGAASDPVDAVKGMGSAQGASGSRRIEAEGAAGRFRNAAAAPRIGDRTGEARRTVPAGGGMRRLDVILDVEEHRRRAARRPGAPGFKDRAGGTALRRRVSGGGRPRASEFGKGIRLQEDDP